MPEASGGKGSWYRKILLSLVELGFRALDVEFRSLGISIRV